MTLFGKTIQVENAAMTMLPITGYTEDKGRYEVEK
jgi:hypothetical protein